MTFNIFQNKIFRQLIMITDLSHCTTINTYLLTLWSTVLLEKLTGLQIVKKFPSFYGNRRLNTAFTSSRPPVPVLRQLDPVHTPTSHFLKIYLNIIFPPTPGSPKWTLSLRFSHQYPVYASPLPHTRYMPRPFQIFL